MKEYKKLKFSAKEIKGIMESLDGYIWIAIDARKGAISAGDVYVADLRDVLLIKRSKVEDIFGAGLDLETGRIDYLQAINRRNPSIENGEPTDENKRRIETLVRYFFADIPSFVAERSGPRYSRKPSRTMIEEN